MKLAVFNLKNLIKNIITDNMNAYLMSDESIAEQIEIIIANVCPQVADPARCDAGTRANWEAIGNYILVHKYQICM